MYLGIDIGTSGVKTVMLDAAQSVVASSVASLEVSRPRSGWSEQDPYNWWAAVKFTLLDLAKSHPAEMSAVRGIGLSGQMHGATLLDKEDKPLRPAILWNDGRCAAECEILDKRADFRGIGGNLVMPGFTAPKLEWVLRHEPGVFEATRKVLLPKDYIRLMLTGEYVSDMSDSAGTLWLDVARRKWSSELLAATGLGVEHMPRLVEGSEASAQVRAELSAELGFASPPVVAGGAGDNAASACGIGAVAPGRAFLSLGTSGVLFVSNDKFSPNTANAVHAFCHALPNTWHQMGVILSATDSLNWLGRVTGADPSALAGALTNNGQPQVSPLLFLPYLSGERTPHNDASARGGFVGLGQDTSLEDMTRAVMEGVAFAFKDSLLALQLAGAVVERMTIVGGGARSEIWVQMLADVLGCAIDLPENGDFGAAFGAARLGMLAVTGENPTHLCAPPAIKQTFCASAEANDLYQGKFQRYRALYPALKEVMS